MQILVSMSPCQRFPSLRSHSPNQAFYSHQKAMSSWLGWMTLTFSMCLEPQMLLNLEMQHNFHLGLHCLIQYQVVWIVQRMWRIMWPQIPSSMSFHQTCLIILNRFLVLQSGEGLITRLFLCGCRRMTSWIVSLGEKFGMSIMRLLFNWLLFFAVCTSLQNYICDPPLSLSHTHTHTDTKMAANHEIPAHLCLVLVSWSFYLFIYFIYLLAVHWFTDPEVKCRYCLAGQSITLSLSLAFTQLYQHQHPTDGKFVVLWADLDI